MVDVDDEPWRGMLSGNSRLRKVLEKVNVNGVLCIYLRQVLSDICSVQKGRTRDALFERLNY